MANVHSKIAGFTLIELMIGMLVGFFIMAAVTSMTINAFKSRKDIEASAKLNQELGAVMAVMSNEIRRAGFNACDAGSFVCHVENGGEVPYLSYALVKDLEIADVDGSASVDDGNCILYRYNTNRDGTDDLGEQRGFRLTSDNIIQMAGTAGGVACDTDTNWVDLTDENVIKVTELNFTTDGSKCNSASQFWMTLNNSNSTEFPCIEEDGNVNLCKDRNSDNVITYPGECSSETSPSLASGDKTLEVRQVNITIEGELEYDDSVVKTLNTSVRVANPRITEVP